jgi:hypothetical protein
MTAWTPDEIISWGTCYPAERIRELTAGVQSVTPQWIAALPIPAIDRCCLLLRAEAMGEERQRWMLARWGYDECDYAPWDGMTPLTWSVLRASADRARRTKERRERRPQSLRLPFEDQLPMILEAYETD